MAYCIYLRKSRADMEAEAHGEGETLARHEKMLLEVAQRNHYAITQIYREIVSGETIAARPVVQHLLQEVEDGKWQGVLVAEVERLARGDTIDQGVMAQAFKYSNTLIITPSKVYNPNDEFDEEYFEFGLFMSRREYKTINRRLQRGHIASAKEGKWVSGIAPYGYERVRIKGDKGWTLSPIESEADIVRYIFRLYTSGEENEDGSIRHIGTYTLALRLDEMGITPPRSASCWHYKSILGILQNPVYIGKIRWNAVKIKKKVINNKIEVERYKTPIEDVVMVDGLHPAIVDDEVFQKAQELLRQSGPTPVPSNRTIKNPLAGILRCGKCGHSIISRASGGGIMIRCPNRACDNVGSKFSVVEERLLQVLADWLSSYRLEWSDKPPAEEQALIDLKHKSIHKAEKELETLRKQLDRTHDLLEQGIYDTEAFLSRSRLLNERITNTMTDIENLSAEVREDERRAACRVNIIPEVEKLLEVYPTLTSAQAKNELMKSVLEKAVYTKNEKSKKGGPLDNFELVIFPKLPKSQ